VGKNWDDVLLYLESPKERQADFTQQKVADLSSDIQVLKEDNVRFTPDYREMWNELDRIMSRSESTDAARDDAPKSASSRVNDVMRRLASREYQELAAQHARERDSSWKRD
jgi:hypothetical protein